MLVQISSWALTGRLLCTSLLHLPGYQRDPLGRRHFLGQPRVPHHASTPPTAAAGSWDQPNNDQAAGNRRNMSPWRAAEEINQTLAPRRSDGTCAWLQHLTAAEKGAALAGMGSPGGTLAVNPDRWMIRLPHTACAHWAEVETAVSDAVRPDRTHVDRRQHGEQQLIERQHVELRPTTGGRPNLMPNCMH